jgi:hypothetical protein
MFSVELLQLPFPQRFKVDGNEKLEVRKGTVIQFQDGIVAIEDFL